MQDKALIEPYAVQEFFVDGFADFYVADGVLRCVGYRVQPPRAAGGLVKVAVMRVVVPASGASVAADLTKEAVRSVAVPGLVIARGRMLS